MSNPKLTPWFPGDVKPARVGVYERKTRRGMTYRYSFWSGVNWMLSGATPVIAADHGGGKSTSQHDEWRGLAIDPRAKS